MKSQQPGRTEAAERIIDAAKRMFAEAGYDAVSIRDIAAAAGVSKANVFHHFASKEELYQEALHRSCAKAKAVLCEMAQTNHEPGEQLRSFFYSDLSRSLADPDGSRLLLAEGFDCSEKQAKYLVSQVFGHDFERLTEIIANDQTKGNWRSEIDPAAIATLMIAANTFFIAYRQILRQLPGVDFADDPERYADSIVELLLNGIRKEEQ
ncbi:TetR/AcrR family transcriptional regulator [Halorhodospira halochloris]|uniref:TetR/AcrR family transcriptional regulator n=1 Tax=Halorhodospira halochloris TaxID=1052 RepID=UPI001EE8CF52|nr:TetR/AcrR family transcriptional regulator [Halorhodospira halochloris]MCG5530606.1 TetR/AcrR family transcriptional regulator [Halorhodospira halochloris]